MSWKKAEVSMVLQLEAGVDQPAFFNAVVQQARESLWGKASQGGGPLDGLVTVVQRVSAEPPSKKTRELIRIDARMQADDKLLPDVLAFLLDAYKRQLLKLPDGYYAVQCAANDIDPVVAEAHVAVKLINRIVTMQFLSQPSKTVAATQKYLQAHHAFQYAVPETPPEEKQRLEQAMLEAKKEMYEADAIEHSPYGGL